MATARWKQKKRWHGRPARKVISAIIHLAMPTAESTSIFSRLIEPDVGSMPADMARYILALDFRGEDHDRFEELSTKAKGGTLTEEEARQLDAYLHVDSLLAILRLKAQRSLRQAG